MKSTLRLLKALEDGKSRTVDALLLESDMSLDTAYRAIRELLVDGHATVRVTAKGLKNLRDEPQRMPVKQVQINAARRRARREVTDRQARVASAVSEPVRGVSKPVATMVQRAMTNPHPLHAAWGGARQGAGA